MKRDMADLNDSCLLAVTRDRTCDVEFEMTSPTACQCSFPKERVRLGHPIPEADR